MDLSKRDRKEVIAMTKQNIFALLAAYILLVAFIAMGCAVCAKAEAIEDVYAMTTVVVALDHEEDSVTCQDFNGNLWVFYGVEDWSVGDVATLIMWNAESDIIYDDEVLDAYYSGWFDLPQLTHWLNH